MSRIRADKFVNNAATGAPQLTYGAEVVAGVGLTGAGGINITGVATAASFVGNITGNATGLSGTPNITVGNITASSGDLSVRNITGVAATFSGVLTYEDVTSVDSVGIVTARGGLNVVGGCATVTGIATFHGGADFNSLLKESVNITAGKLSDNTNINLDNGMLHLFTTAETTTATPNIISNTGINTDLSVGDALSVTVVTTAAAAGYAATVHIDGLSLGANAGSLNWTGGTAPTAGGASGVDIYAYTIMKTASNKYTVIASLTKTSA